MGPWGNRILVAWRSSGRSLTKSSLSITEAFCHRPLPCATSAYKAHYSTSSPTESSPADDVPVAGPAKGTPLRGSGQQSFYRAVHIFAYPSVTRSDIARGIAETAPVGAIVFLNLREKVAGKKSRKATIMFFHGSSARALTRLASRKKFRIKGKRVLVRVADNLPSHVQQESRNLRVSRVVLVCAPRGELPSETDIRQPLPDHPSKWETEPVETYSVSGDDGADVDVMEWRFFSLFDAKAFATAVQSQLAHNMYTVFGKDPCHVKPAKGYRPMKQTRKRALDALTDHSKRADAFLKRDAEE